jgi:GMP synthase-like glutamine amidotransferase
MTRAGPRVLVVEHDHVSPPGPVAERFADHGYDVVELLVVPGERFHDPNVDMTFPDPADYDVIVPMGAPWSAYAHETIGAWVLPELDFLRRADAEGVPVLGICFGGQLLATAHGGAVAASPHPEVGWSLVHSDDETLVPGGAWFQWHYDRWTTPAAAREVARNAAASQAFVLRRNLALQFHPELTVAMLEGWFDNGGRRKAAAHGLDPDVLLAHTAALRDDVRRRSDALVDAFLTRVATA